MNKLIEYVQNNLPYDIFSDKDITQSIPQKSNDSRYSLIKRALKNNDILRLKRGLYCLTKKYQKHPLDNFSISQIVYGPSYVSMESALSYYGLIPEGVFITTCVSMNRSMAFKTDIGDFVYHRVPQGQLYAGVKQVMSENSLFYIASPWKALCDYVYVHKANWASIDPLENSLRIDPETLPAASKEEFCQLMENYHSKRVTRFIKGIMKDLKI